MLLSAGYATVPDRIPPHMDRALFTLYSKLMSEARTSQKGIFAPDAAKHVRQLRNYTVDELTKLANQLTGKKVVVVAAVPAVNGSTTGAGTGRRTATAADSTTTTIAAAAMTTNNPIISSTTATITAAATTNNTTAGSSLASKVKSGIIATRPDGSDGVPYTGPVQFTGILVQAVHGDTLVIRDDDTHQLIRVSLAGVRTSKNIVHDKDGRAAEARVTYHECA
ncbi:hypothetical protein O3M35_000175 [Rhynocoris fuscipes]|uniref:Uncharacterized protein n=1 Tax=Rhynocoris fuscipes TaxID=488301 RepID=A0AAW1DS32_9HEMI